MTSAFQRMNIAAGGTIHNALTARRVLHAMLDDRMFVIAHDDDREAALRLAAQYAEHGPAVTVLFTDEHLAAVAAGTPRLDVDVLDAQANNRVAGQIKVNGDCVALSLRTEQGTVLSTVIATRDLRTGDLFACGEFAVDGAGGRHGLVLYRALADYEPATGTVERHILTPTWDTASPGDRENLTSPFTAGPDRLVFRAIDRTRLPARLGVRDLANAAR